MAAAGQGGYLPLRRDLDESSPVSAALRAGRRIAGLSRQLGEVMLLEAPALPPGDDGRRGRGALLARHAARACVEHGIRVDARGPTPPAGCVLVANHLSYVDPLLLAGVAPCVAIAKGEISSWPVLGRVLGALGLLFVRRGDAASGAVVLRGAIRALRAGVGVVNFPEGTTTAGDRLLPFRRGIFGAARIVGAPVVAASVRFDDPELCWVGGATFGPHYLRTVRRLESRVTVSFSPPLDARAFRSADALATHVREHLACELGVPLAAG
ncbi:MAG: 1-acyl-sn-glycerol-3-phosphate acyltransferase [Polyangiaceae bacterium]|nr:1-acyl-sn-glycerol-3-phosphate acyltransferase [Polyangiaceae bacterium]